MNNVDILEIIKNSFDLLEVEIEHDYYGTDYVVLHTGGAIRYIEKKLKKKERSWDLKMQKMSAKKIWMMKIHSCFSIYVPIV